MKRILVLAVLLSGCATKPVLIDPVEVKVPVAVKCEPTIKITPANNAFDRATKDMTLYEKFELVLEELHSYRGRDKELTAALKECTK